MASKCSDSHPDKDCHLRIKFINKSLKDVYTYRSGYGNYGAPDTSFFVPRLNLSDKIKSNETNTYALTDRYCLEYWFEREKGGLNVFVLDAEVYETVPRDTILKYRMVLKTIHPTIEEMQNSNWTITYTGE
jgi:hypothetical protein